MCPEEGSRTVGGSNRRCPITTGRTTRWIAAAVPAVLALSLAACAGSGDDKAGGTDEAGPRVLTMASAFTGEQPPQLTTFAEQVAKLSDGKLRIEFREGWRPGEADYEAGTIEDVKAGKVDLAWVGARVFDTLGVTDFQPLVAPFLVDSHDLQQRVFEEGIPEEMLGGLEQLDLVGIGALPGPMRALLGITHSFTKPADFADETVGIQYSDVARLTFAALGATAKAVPSSAELDGLDAYEQQLGSIESSSYDEAADSVTAGVTFWPRPLVILTSASLFEQLSREQRNALLEAAESALPGAMAAARQEDADAAATLCGGALEFVEPTAADFSAIRAAVEPVVDRIAADPAAGPFLERIRSLREEMRASATRAGPSCTETGPAVEANGKATPLDGSYRLEVCRDDWLAAVGLDGAEVPEALGGFTLELRIAGGGWRVDQEPDGWALVGAARVAGDLVELAPEKRPGHAWRLRWSRYRDTLALEPEQGTRAPYWLRLGEWQRTGDAGPEEIDPDLARATLPPNGVYRRSISQEELLRAGIAPGEEDSYGGTVELHFSDGGMAAHWLGPEVVVDPTRVEVDGDLLRFEWAEPGPADGAWFMSLSSGMENGALRFREFHGFGPDLGLIGFVGGPWKRVG